MHTQFFFKKILLILLVGVVVFAGIFYSTKPEPTGPVPDFPDTGTVTAAADDIVIYADDSPTIVGTEWVLEEDATAASGQVLHFPHKDASKINPALASPTSYVEYTFTAASDTPYHLWMRMKALSNNTVNDDIHVQFSDSLNSSGTLAYRIGTTGSAIVILEELANAGVAGWGWNDNYVNASIHFGTSIMFENSGTHTLRLQQREDGIYVDEIVLSPATYLSASPGLFKDDTNIVLKYGTEADATPPVISDIATSSITTTGATITWTTDESSTSSVAHGLTTSYGATANSGGTTSHTVTLTDLEPDTLYNYQISATDGTLNNALSANQTFSTLPVSADTTAPVISAIATSDISTTGVTISWTTDESSTSSAAYGLTTSYGETANSAGATAHSVTLTGLSVGTAYNYQISATDTALNNVLSTNQTFTTSSAAVTTSPSIAPESPRVFIDTTYPTLSSTRGVRYVKTSCAGVADCTTSLQTAIDEAALGDEIIIDAGLIIDGPITLKEKTTGSGWIVIRSSNLSSLPAAGNRISPSDAVDMPKIVSLGAGTKALETADRAHNYRLVGIEFKEKVPSDDSNILVQLGPVNSYCATETDLYVVCSDQSVLDNYPYDITLDRVYIHGDPLYNTLRGVGLDTKSTAIIDSYISDIHVVGQDSQAIAGLYGPGPYKIVNNYLEGAAENIIFGGDDPRLEDLIPSDIEIRNNYLYKPLSWRCEDADCSNTRHWAVKNLFELKNAQRVLIDGNIMENNWSDGQAGIAILFNTTNQGGACLWCAVMDVTFSNNIIRHSGGGVSIQANDWHYPASTGRAQRIKIYNNLFEDLDAVTWKNLKTDTNAASYLFFLSSGADEPGPDDIEINHNTAFHSGTVVTMDKPNPAGGFFAKPRFTYINNISKHNSYGVLGSTSGIGNTSIADYLPGALFIKNILMGERAVDDTRDWSGVYNNYPGNYFPKDWSTVFVNQASGDYNVQATSIYNDAGTDEEDLGADIDAIDSATANVISGINFPSSPDTIPPIISSIVTSNITTSGADIAWTTDESSTSSLAYGLTSLYDTTQNSSGTTSHTVTLTGLTPDTLYNFRISATDAAGNNSLSTNQTFTAASIITPSTSSSSSGRGSEDIISNSSDPIPSPTYDFGPTTLGDGSTGAAVMELQRFLNDILNLGLVVDGILGPKTTAVIRQWQSENSLAVDGLVGPKTKAKMNTEGGL